MSEAEFSTPPVAQSSGGIGRAVLVASGAGYPMTQWTIRRSGRRGAFVVEGVSAALLVRDAVLIGTGVPGVLRRGPGLLLWCEAGAAATASVLGAAASRVAAANTPGHPRPDARELLRRTAVVTLFGLHTVRFAIYLSPDQGRRSP
jgi:hypothetical protein